MTDEQKLIAAGFVQFGTTFKLNYKNNFGVWSILVDTQEFYAELSQFRNLQWVSRLKTAAQTVDDVLTLARLLGLSKEVE